MKTQKDHYQHGIIDGGKKSIGIKGRYKNK